MDPSEVTRKLEEAKSSGDFIAETQALTEGGGRLGSRLNKQQLCGVLFLCSVLACRIQPKPE